MRDYSFPGRVPPSPRGIGCPAALGLVFLFLSCAGSAKYYREIDRDVHAGSFENARFSIEEVQRNGGPVYGKKNAVLFYLDIGMVSHYAGLYLDSSVHLETGEKLIEEAFTKSVTQNAASFIVNDNVKDYPGEDYEDLYINVFNSLNYYHQGSLEGALVEIRRLNEKLVHLSDKYERVRTKVRDAEGRIDKSGVDLEAVKFSNSALARYLGILFYRGEGRMDDARIDRDEFYRAYELAPAVYVNPPPLFIGEELEIPSGMGRLNFVSFTGLSPVKTEEVIRVPLKLPPPNTIVKIALPQMRDRPSAIRRVEAVLSTGERCNLELVENMGMVARETFKASYSMTMLKTIARVVLKAGVGTGAAAVVKEQWGEGASLLVGVLAAAVTNATEAADIRMARYFPGFAYGGGITLKPGVYGCTINYYGDRGLLFSEKHENIRVRENKLNLVESICLK